MPIRYLVPLCERRTNARHLLADGHSIPHFIYGGLNSSSMTADTSCNSRPLKGWVSRGGTAARGKKNATVVPVQADVSRTEENCITVVFSELYAVAVALVVRPGESC